MHGPTNPKRVQVSWSGKRKVHSSPCAAFSNAHKDVGAVQLQFHALLTSVLEGEWLVRFISRPLYPRATSSRTYWTQMGYVPTAGLKDADSRKKKLCRYRESDPNFSVVYLINGTIRRRLLQLLHSALMLNLWLTVWSVKFV